MMNQQVALEMAERMSREAMLAAQAECEQLRVENGHLRDELENVREDRRALLCLVTEIKRTIQRFFSDEIVVLKIMKLMADYLESE